MQHQRSPHWYSIIQIRRRQLFLRSGLRGFLRLVFVAHAVSPIQPLNDDHTTYHATFKVYCQNYFIKAHLLSQILFLLSPLTFCFKKKKLICNLFSTYTFFGNFCSLFLLSMNRNTSSSLSPRGDSTSSSYFNGPISASAPIVLLREAPKNEGDLISDTQSVLSKRDIDRLYDTYHISQEAFCVFAPFSSIRVIDQIPVKDTIIVFDIEGGSPIPSRSIFYRCPSVPQAFDCPTAS